MTKKEYRRQYYLANKEKEKARARKYYNDNKEVCKANHAEWAKENADKRNQTRRDKYQNDEDYRSKILESMKGRPQNNARKTEWQRNKYQNDPEFRARNIEHANRRRLKIKQGEIIDGDLQRLRAVYEFAAVCRDLGLDVHVDHVVPLSKGGEHHVDNLQIIPAVENLKKGNDLVHFELYDPN
jgi:5-methylcytosine-specific restriction endonuclease McrA